MYDVSIAIGGVPLRLCTDNPEFAGMLRKRYQGFLTHSSDLDCELEIETVPPQRITDVEDVVLARNGNEWTLRRGDFLAIWDPDSRRGRVRETANPYSIDSVLRIIHTLILAGDGGFLLHAASAIRHGKAFLFSGVSGAGKTTISRLAPADVVLLSDEVSYVRREGNIYRAYGTPFAGELAKNGENVSAPITAAFLLAKAGHNQTSELRPIEATREILRNVLFFARDPKLAERVLETALDFVFRVPVKRLSFFPDRSVWNLIT